MSQEGEKGELEYRPFKMRDCVIEAGDVRIIIDKSAGRVVIGTPEGKRSRIARTGKINREAESTGELHHKRKNS